MVKEAQTIYWSAIPVIKSSCQVYSLLLVLFWPSTRSKEFPKNFLHKKLTSEKTFFMQNFPNQKSLVTTKNGHYYYYYFFFTQFCLTQKKSPRKLFFQDCFFMLCTTQLSFNNTSPYKKSHKKTLFNFSQILLPRQLNF